MQIYVTRNGQRVGPFSIEEINRQLAAGALDPSDQAWSEGSPGWKPLLSFAGVIVPGGASSTAALISIATPIAPPPPHYAGFWIRVLAYLIDCALLTIVCGVPARILLSRTSSEASGIPTVEAIIWIAINCAYWAILWSSPMQATLGQAICRLKVVRAMSGGQNFFRPRCYSVVRAFVGNSDCFYRCSHGCADRAQTRFARHACRHLRGAKPLDFDLALVGEAVCFLL